MALDILLAVLMLHTNCKQFLMWRFVLVSRQCMDQDRKLLIESGDQSTEQDPSHT